MSADNHTAPVEYRKIARFVGYRFGDDGSIWCRWKFGTSGIGHEWRRVTGRSKASPYFTVSIKDADLGKSATRYVHRLIAEAFMGPCPKGMEVRHRNNIKTDCQASNLVYGTRFANMHDKFKHGTQQRGDSCYNATLTWPMVRLIRRARRRGVCRKAIADHLGITIHRVGRVDRFEIWKPIHFSAKQEFMPPGMQKPSP